MSGAAKIDGIQALRTISILMVLIDHALGMAALDKYYGSQVTLSLHSGHMGVALFFIISGFIICHVTAGKSGMADFVDYVRSRFVRIFPLLWLCVGMYFLLRLLGRGEFSGATLLRSLFLFPLGEIKPNALWSLRHEILFYAVFALVLFNRRAGLALVIAWCLICLFLGTMTYSDFPSLMLSTTNAWFLCGIIMALLYAQAGLLTRLRWPLLCIALSLSLLTAGLRLTGWEVVVLSSLFLLGISVPTDLSTTPLRRLVLKLGNASYAIYLTHEAIISAGYGFTVRLLPDYQVAVPLLLVVLSLFVGLQFHLRVEQPLIRSIRRRLSGQHFIQVGN